MGVLIPCFLPAVASWMGPFLALSYQGASSPPQPQEGPSPRLSFRLGMGNVYSPGAPPSHLASAHTSVTSPLISSMQVNSASRWELLHAQRTQRVELRSGSRPWTYLLLREAIDDLGHLVLAAGG